MLTPGYPPVGAQSTFRKTVTEADVGLFAGITGDFAPQHIDEEFMRSRPQGRRIAHGVLTLGLTSTASARLCEAHQVTAVSYGYDSVRFLRPVYLGDTVTVEYAVRSVDTDSRKAHAEMTVTRPEAEVCLVGVHILYCYPPDEPGPAGEREA